MGGKMHKAMLTAGTLLLLAFGGYMLQAQDGPPGGPGGPGNDGFRPPDPERMQSMMLERFQEELGVSDDEWPVVKPLIADVMKLQMSQMQGPPGMMGPGGGPMGPPPGGQGSGGQMAPPPGAQDGQPAGNAGGPPPQGLMGAANPEAQALQAALDAEDSTNEVIQTKLNAFREAKAEKEAALKAAREKLRAVLTLRQEATLVLAGLLD